MSKLSIIAAAALSSIALSATAATADLGNLTDTTSSTQSFIYASIAGINLNPRAVDRFEFDLSFASDVTIDIYSRLAITAGGEFDLYNDKNQLIDSKGLDTAVSLGTVLGSSIGITGRPAQNRFNHSQLTFTNVAAGNDYQFRFDPGLFALAVNYRVSFTGTTLAAPNPPTPAVPEPESYALALAGLGVVFGLSRRRLQKH